jgi:hypothetical protein
MTLSNKAKQQKIDDSRRRPSELSPRSRYQDFLDGVVEIDDLDIEELQRVRIKDYDGKFNGARQRIPLPLQNRMNRALQKYLASEFQKYGIDAIETISDVMYRGEGASAFQGQKDGTKRLDAAKYIIERIIGPIPSKTEVTTNVTVWEGLQETGGLFVDVEVTDMEEVNRVQKAEPAVRKRGPRTRPARP